MYASVPTRRPLVLPTVRPITSLVVLMALLASTLAGIAQPGQFMPRSTPAVPALPDLEQLPLAFEPNAGQVDPQVRFQARGLGGMVYFTDREIVMTLPQPADGAAHSETLGVLRLAFDGASTPEVAGADPLPGTVSYFIGDDSTRWRNGIATYAGIVYRELYPGVDLRYDGAGGRLKGTYTVAAGADPASIRWRYTGADAVAVDAATGALRVTPAGAARGAALTEAAPIAWQEIGARRVPVDARYAVAPDGGASFVLGAYDRTQPLIIDPTLTFSTALGGSGRDEATGVAVDPAGNTYITGYTSSTNFPTGNAVQTTLKGGADTFVTKINPEGTARVYSTYLGGAQIEGYFGGGAIAADQAGNAYITGSTTSADFPTVGAIQDKIVHDSDFYVVKLSPSGNGLVYSTYLGGSERDVGEGIAVDYDGNAYVTGGAGRNFPLANPIFPYSGSDAVVAKLNAGGSKLVYSTFLGGSGIDAGQAIAVDWEGSAYVGGYSTTVNSTGFPLVNALQPTPGGGNRDGFVTKLNPAGDALVYSTYLGGAGDDWVEGVAVDAAGNVAVMGNTASTNFPMRSAYQGTYGGGTLDAFVTKLNAAGNDFVFSTYLGGSLAENSVSNREGGIAVDPEGGIYVTGWTGSTNFPLVDPMQPRRFGSDAFVTKFRANGTMVYSTPLGGNGTEFGMGVAVDDAGTAHVAGTTQSPDFPTVAPLQATLANNSNFDAFVSRIAHGPGRTVMFDPGAVVFGTEPLDVASLPETVYIGNAGTAALPLGGVTLTGPHAGDFTVTKNNCASRSLAAGVECRIEVRFKPLKSGARTARIVVESSVWDGPRSIFLRGTGRPNVVVNPAEVDFGFQIKDAATPAQSVTLTNLASSPQAISTPTITGLHKDDFAFTSTCGSAIPAAGSCAVGVTFTPKALDGRYARLSVLPQGADQPLVVPLSGFGGTTPSIAVSQPGATAVGDIPLFSSDAPVQVTGRNFPITASNNNVRISIGGQEIAVWPVQADRTIIGEFILPAGLEGEITVDAQHLGQTVATTSARFRTPLEDIPVILIPGVSGTMLVAEEAFTYVAPGNPELAVPIPNPLQLLPQPYTYHAGMPLWINAQNIYSAVIGHDRYIDALMLNHYGSTPEPDVLGDSSRKIVPGDVLWNVDIGVKQEDFYGKLRDHLLSLGYTAAGKAGTGSGSKLLYYFGYDWRKDVYGTGPDLNALVKRAMAESGKTKVNIIAHSMGGWVTRNYLLQYGATDVDQVITLGTPFLGAPKALKVLEHGDEWGMIWHPANDWGGPLGDLGLGLHPKQMKRLAQNFPAAYELLPSKYWFQGRPFSFTADPAYITRSVNNSGTMEYELLGFGASSQFLRQRHNYDLVRTAERFHAQGIGDLSLLTNQYIHHRIAGTEVSTNGRIEFSPRKVCATVIVVVCTDLPEFAFPKMNLLGDGTVPFHSALGAFAPPDARIYQVPGAKHNPLTSDPRSLTLVTQLLNGVRTNNRTGPKDAALASPAGAPAADMPTADSAAAAEPGAESFIASGVEIAVLGAGNLTITDDQGRVTGHVPGSHYATIQQIPGVTFETGEGAQVAMLPATGTFQVTIRGTPAGGAAQLRMSEVTGNTNTKTLVFQGIPLTAETVATTTASGAGVPGSSTLNFKYDASTPEQPVGTLPPVIGAESKDMTPPLSKIAMSEDGVITLTAQDEAGGSGVASILYSTDGVTYKTYTGPFRAPSGTRLITAVAVDRVGNAESPGAQVTLNVVEPTATPVPATPTPTATSQPTVPTPTPNGRGTVYLPLVQR